jgi:hypothetical protein
MVPQMSDVANGVIFDALSEDVQNSRRTVNCANVIRCPGLDHRVSTFGCDPKSPDQLGREYLLRGVFIITLPNNGHRVLSSDTPFQLQLRGLTTPPQPIFSLIELFLARPRRDCFRPFSVREKNALSRQLGRHLPHSIAVD